MKKLVSVLFAIAISSLSFAQENKQFKSDKIADNIFEAAQINELQPVFVIVIDSVEYRIKNLKFSELDHGWIRSVDVLKDDASNKRYNSKYGVVKIHVKKEYGYKVLNLIEKKRFE